MKIRQLTFILTKLIIDTLASREKETLLLKFDGIERYLPVAKSSTVKGSGDGAERKCTVQMSYDQAPMLLEEKLLDVEVLREDTLPSF
jgi:hypothetical protein